MVSQNLNQETKLPADLLAYRDIEIYPKLPGFIEWIGVDRGSVVKKGQLLIRMTAPELPAQSKQGVDAATATKDESTQAADELDVVKQQLVAAQAKAKSSADTYQRLKSASAYPGIIAGNDLEIAQRTAEADAAIGHSLEGKCKSLKSQMCIRDRCGDCRDYHSICAAVGHCSALVDWADDQHNDARGFGIGGRYPRR